MNVGEACLYFHYIVILAVLIAPFIISQQAVKAYIVFVVVIIIHWYILEGKCIISLMHRDTSNDDGAIAEFFTRHNMKLNRKLLDVILYGLLLFAFYRIDRLKEGLLVVIIIILINKAVYDSYNFRWSRKKKLAPLISSNED